MNLNADLTYAWWCILSFYGLEKNKHQSTTHMCVCKNNMFQYKCHKLYGAGRAYRFTSTISIPFSGAFKQKATYMHHQHLWKHHSSWYILWVLPGHLMEGVVNDPWHWPILWSFCKFSGLLAKLNSMLFHQVLGIDDIEKMYGGGKTWMFKSWHKML